MSLQICKDTTEAVDLCEYYGLFLKPISKIKICVQLPVLKTPGQSISSWEVMEKIKKMIKPDEFIALKVSKTNLILIQFEGELEKKTALKRVLQKLQSNTMKLSGFTEVLKIRAAIAKLNYPSRHDWDSFYRDAKNVDEMKPGERPDTVYIQNLPIKWFLDQNSDLRKPSELVLRNVFQTFGDVRRVEIPSKESPQNSTETFGKVSTFKFSQELVFEAYIQFKEYMGFIKAMDTLRGMKLVLKTCEGKAHSADIKVDFDKTNYLSDRSIRRRALEQQKLIEQSHAKQQEASKQSVVNVAELEEKIEIPVVSIKQSSKKINIKKIDKTKAIQLRKKEAECLLKELLHRSEVALQETRTKEKEEQVEKERLQQQKLIERRLQEEKKLKEAAAKQKQKYLHDQERLLREKLLKSLKVREQRRTEEIREKLRKDLAGRRVLKSVLVLAHKKNTSESYEHRLKRQKS